MPTDPIRVFISFDYDHDLDVKNLFVGQARHSETPFTVADWSISVASPGWKEDARRRIRSVDQVVVLCGGHTHTATGVSEEVRIAQAEDVPYFLLAARGDTKCQKPLAALPTDKLYNWTWSNLGSLLNGDR